MNVKQEDRRNSAEAHSRSDGANQQQEFPAEFIDHRHGNHGEDEVCCSDRNRLEVTGYGAEACLSEDVIDVIENRVHTGELVEHSNGYGEKDW